MRKREPNPGHIKRPGSISERVRALADSGITADEAREVLEDEGVSPGTIEAYFAQFFPPVSAWIGKARGACEAHLADLQREHGGARHAV